MIRPRIHSSVIVKVLGSILNVCLFFAVLNSTMEPDWSLERRDSGRLFWRREASKVRFRYEVEVLEYEKDPSEHMIDHTEGHPRSSVVFVAGTCMVAIAITVLLPWLLIGGVGAPS